MSWICSKCETENPDGVKICEVCDSPHPSKPVDEIRDIYIHPAYVGFMRFHYQTMKKAHNGETAAQFELAEWLRNRKSGDLSENRRLAVQWYFKAAIRGMTAAQYWLAYHYQMGEGTEKNLREAETWFLKAAQKGHLNSQYELGLIYEKQGNRKGAMFWYGSAAAHGHYNAQDRLMAMKKIYTLDNGTDNRTDENKSTPVTTSSNNPEDIIGKIFIGIIVGVFGYYMFVGKLKEWGVSIPDDSLQINPFLLFLFIFVSILIVFLSDD